MDKDWIVVGGMAVLAVLGALGAVIAVLGLMIILSTLMGAVCGLIVGLFFGDTILGIAGQIGIHHVTMWQLGAFLGFVGSFFRSHTARDDD